MNLQRPISWKARAGFFSGLLCLFLGFLALVSTSDLFLLGVAVFFLAALILGVLGLREVRRQPDRFRGRGLATCAIGLPVGGFCLAFLVLPNI